MYRAYSGPTWHAVECKDGRWHVGYWMAGGRFASVESFESAEAARIVAAEKNRVTDAYYEAGR